MMTKQKRVNENPRLAVLLDRWELGRHDSDSTHYKVSIVRVDPSDDKPRNVSRSYDGCGIFEDLEFQAYITWRDGEFQCMFFDAEYRDLYSVDLAKAQLMVKGLKKVGKIRASFPLQPTTFGQFVVLMAAGLGVKECVSRVEDSPSGGFYTDCDWHYRPIASAQYFIDNEIDGIRAKMMPETVQAVA